MAARAAVVTLRVVGLAGLVAAVGFGAAGVVSGFFEQTATATRTVNGSVTALDVNGGAGDVSVAVVPAGRPVRVTTTRRWAFTEPGATQTVAGGTLRLRDACSGGIVFGRCSVDWAVEVPAGTVVTVRTGFGAVSVTGPTGAVDVRTGAGTVTLADSRSRSVIVETGAGNIRLGFVAVPDAVRTTTGAGDVSVTLPGSVLYRVTGTTGAGTRRIDVGQDPSSGHVVRVDTGSGDVTVTGAG